MTYDEVVAALDAWLGANVSVVLTSVADGQVHGRPYFGMLRIGEGNVGDGRLFSVLTEPSGGYAVNPGGINFAVIRAALTDAHWLDPGLRERGGLTVLQDQARITLFPEP